MFTIHPWTTKLDSLSQISRWVGDRRAIPVNPNIRETEGFRFSRRLELLRYSIATHKRVMTLDRHVGQLIRKHWAAGAFPKRFHNLLFVGERQRVLANNRLETDLRPAREARRPRLLSLDVMRALPVRRKAMRKLLLIALIFASPTYAQDHRVSITFTASKPTVRRGS